MTPLRSCVARPSIGTGNTVAQGSLHCKGTENSDARASDGATCVHSGRGKSEYELGVTAGCWKSPYHSPTQFPKEVARARASSRYLPLGVWLGTGQPESGH